MTVATIFNRWRWTLRGKRVFNQEKEMVGISTDAFIGDENHSSKTWLKSQRNNYLTTFCIKNETTFTVTLNQGQAFYMLGFILKIFFMDTHTHTQ